MTNFLPELRKPGKLYRWLATGLVAVTIPAIGCGEHGDRLGVRGAVTVDGEPLGQGSISFQPTGSTRGNTAGAVIRDGSYKIASDVGLAPGEYRVTFQATKTTGNMVQDAQRGPVPEILTLELAESPFEVTITAANSKQLDFNLTTQP